MGSGRGWLAVDGGVVNITAAAWTAGFQWWRSGDITRKQNVSEYMLVYSLYAWLVLVSLLLNAKEVIGCLSFAVIVGVNESTERSEIAIGGRISFRCHRDDIA